MGAMIRALSIFLLHIFRHLSVLILTRLQRLVVLRFLRVVLFIMIIGKILRVVVLRVTVGLILPLTVRERN